MAKKNKTDICYDEDKLANWNSYIQSLKESITDQAAQISNGMVDIEGPEFIVLMQCIEMNRQQIAAYRSLIEEITKK